MLPNTAQGCRQMYIHCSTPAGYARSNMVFNDTPPPLRVGKDVKALISCFKGSWRSSQGGSYIYVTSVRCFATK
ncbi:hypothetical protein OESDEN_03310 [Oesophagostomum dentatum]|uniref:Uncharacterized protein n=1 Tax=Oesophagostomum dentatum TaxID=61180 RepID=A0A0B1TLM9_OESDE|nr:hypothetical protein OESDEN_03310 [Oesophagostomum dentatum]